MAASSSSSTATEKRSNEWRNSSKCPRLCHLCDICYVRTMIHFQRRRALLAAAIGGLIAAPVAAAAMTGFTDEIYYSGFSSGGSSVVSPSYHSYGFNSTNYPGSGSTTVYSGITPIHTGGDKLNSATNFVRTCDSGVYPNCTDYDGFSALTWGFSSSNHTLDEHSMY